MSEKLTLARIKKEGLTFEISVNPDKALLYKKGEVSDLREVLLADNIFIDAYKGLIASHEALAKAFKTTDFAKVASIILKEGEIQLTSEHRAEQREELRRRVVELIRTQAVDPKSGLPHPAARIEAAMDEAKVHLDERLGAQEQLEQVIAKLRVVLPISIEQKKLIITIPSSFVGKTNNVIRSKKVINEDWLSDASWKVNVELPAGQVPDFIDKLNSLTHGEVVVEEKE